MISKLFGATDEEQFNYLKRRLSILGIGIVLWILSGLLGLKSISSIGSLIFVIMAYNFGWAIMRALFGASSVLILFSHNVVLGALIFVVYILLGYLGGLIVAVIGLCRFFVLLKNRKERQKETMEI